MTDIARLLRRVSFGPRPDELAAAELAGFDATLAALLQPGPAVTYPALDPRADRARQKEERRQLALWWVGQMVSSPSPGYEKLVLFWHGHWATSIRKAGPALMARQQQTFRAHAHDFGALSRAMVADPALLVWLDAQQNTKKAPNENLARELLELFTLGVGNYSEDDVLEAARVLTGWRVDRAAMTATLDPKRHDDGAATVLGKTSQFTAQSLVDHLLAQPACAKHVAGQLGAYYGGAGGSLREIWSNLGGEVVRPPIDWAVSAMRQLGVQPKMELLRGLTDLGQVPFAPPNVGGWPSGAAWLTTSAAQARLQVAAAIADAAKTDLSSVPAKERPDRLAKLLAVGAWTDRTRAALSAADRDVKQLVTLGLISPEYLVV
ncbi:DUF1800 domain-containing protein [Longispora albida]|uniref:DUF1800 domain-containing protein n=1 Tax=Longispora albida TaxID=203523 RepID=UPI0003767840|nr:DUF1800 domain-containing protein [Longispora albida]